MKKILHTFQNVETGQFVRMSVDPEVLRWIQKYFVETVPNKQNELN